MVVNRCLGSLTRFSDFVQYLQKEWSLGYPGVIGYMIAIVYILDFRGSRSAIAKKIIQRVKSFKKTNKIGSTAEQVIQHRIFRLHQLLG